MSRAPWKELPFVQRDGPPDPEGPSANKTYIHIAPKVPKAEVCVSYGYLDPDPLSCSCFTSLGMLTTFKLAAGSAGMKEV